MLNKLDTNLPCENLSFLCHGSLYPNYWSKNLIQQIIALRWISVLRHSGKIFGIVGIRRFRHPTAHRGITTCLFEVHMAPCDSGPTPNRRKTGLVACDTYIYVCMYLYLHICFHIYTYINVIFIYRCRQIWIYICIWIYIHICIWIYVQRYIYMQIHTYIYTCEHVYIYA